MPETDYVMCPRCGNPMVYVNGKWYCKICGYILENKKNKQ